MLGSVSMMTLSREGRGLTVHVWSGRGLPSVNQLVQDEHECVHVLQHTLLLDIPPEGRGVGHPCSTVVLCWPRTHRSTRLMES